MRNFAYPRRTHSVIESLSITDNQQQQQNTESFFVWYVFLYLSIIFWCLIMPLSCCIMRFVDRNCVLFRARVCVFWFVHWEMRDDEEAWKSCYAYYMRNGRQFSFSSFFLVPHQAHKSRANFQNFSIFPFRETESLNKLNADRKNRQKINVHIVF